MNNEKPRLFLEHRYHSEHDAVTSWVLEDAAFPTGRVSDESLDEFIDKIIQAYNLPSENLPNVDYENIPGVRTESKTVIQAEKLEKKGITYFCTELADKLSHIDQPNKNL